QREPAGRLPADVHPDADPVRHLAGDHDGSAAVRERLLPLDPPGAAAGLVPEPARLEPGRSGPADDSLLRLDHVPVAAVDPQPVRGPGRLAEAAGGLHDAVLLVPDVDLQLAL